MSHKRESGTPKASKNVIFVSAVNDYQPSTVVIKNFVLDATGVLNPPDRH